MAWLKISDKDGGIYAKEPENDPEQIVSVAEIEAEIKELQSRIDSIHLIEVTKEMSEEVVEAIIRKNEQPRGEIVYFSQILAEKQALLDGLRKL